MQVIFALVVLIVAGAVVLFAVPLAYLYGIYHFRGRIKLQYEFFANTPSELEEIEANKKRASWLKGKLANLGASELTKTVKGTYDRRSKRGKRAFDLDDDLSSAQYDIVDLSERPMRRFRYATGKAIGRWSFIGALIVFAAYFAYRHLYQAPLEPWHTTYLWSSAASVAGLAVTALIAYLWYSIGYSSIKKRLRQDHDELMAILYR